MIKNLWRFLCPPCYADVGGQAQLVERVEEATAAHVIKLSENSEYLNCLQTTLHIQ
jgi:hypothetical protein